MTSPSEGVSWRDYVDIRFKEWERSHAHQTDASQRALENAAEQLTAWKQEHNGFRDQIANERALYVRRDQIDALGKMHAADIERLALRLEKLENWQANLLGRQLVFGGAVIALAGIVTVVLRLVGH